jgi:hypothetical protein
MGSIVHGRWGSAESIVVPAFRASGTRSIARSFSSFLAVCLRMHTRSNICSNRLGENKKSGPEVPMVIKPP